MKYFISSFAMLIMLAHDVAGQKLIILHTNDMHSKLTGFGPESAYTPMSVNDDATKGGFARLATIYKQEQQANPNATLIVDAGDFLMGSIFHAGEPETAFQLSLMKQMGYDVLTIGNHEFDFGPDYLAKILNTAKSNKALLPFVASNMEFSATSALDDNLEKLYQEEIIRPYYILEKNGLKIGFIGLMGMDADDVAPNAKPVTFTKQVKASKKWAKYLKNNKQVDLVVCLSHSGIYPDGKGGYEGEDIDLAKKAKEIDIIISGHTHVNTPEMIKVNNTIIVQAGSYVENVGRLEIEVESGNISTAKFSLIEVDDQIPGDKEIHNQIETYKKTIDGKYFSPFGLSFLKPIAETDFDLLRNSYATKTVGNIGPFLTDAVYYYVNSNGGKADAVIAASGVIREHILAGMITPADVFRVSPLGIGNDDIPGYALSEIYLTGRELKKLGEVIVMAQKPGDDSFINYSGMSFDIDYDKMMLRKIQKVYIDGEEIDVSKKAEKLYCVAASSYLLKFVGEVKKISYGLIKICPKDKSGAIITDMDKQVIDFDPQQEGINEGKTWLALIKYMQTFEDSDNDGIPEIPEKYRMN